MQTKKRALTIHYDAGGLSGNMTQGKKDEGKYRWYKEHNVDGRRVYTLLTNDNTLLVTVASGPHGGANFYAKVKTSEDVTDVLLTAMSWFKL